tara:strand:- start:9518 stop:10279 length:762 start_codon:yes stop_codon:yes gene_type:complete
MAEPPLQVVYQDDALVAVHKPEGLLVHRSNIDRHETRFLLQELRNQLGRHVYPVHRLDKPTSGLILFAFAPETVAQVQHQMETNAASKEYLLVCRGHCPRSGDIDHPLHRVSDFRNNRGRGLNAGEPQLARTLFERLATVTLDVPVDKYPTSRYSLVRARLLTGRKHQIRRHFKHISHPVIGCPKYGKSTHNRYFASELAAPRLLLHAHRMTLRCPITERQLCLTAPLEGTFAALLDRFRWVVPEFTSDLSPP